MPSRPEIVNLYETEIFGRVPANAPKVTWEITSNVNDGTTITKTIVGRIGAGGVPAKGAKSPTITITLTLPAKAGGRVPVIFGGSNKQQVLAKGWGYGTVNYGSVQQDSANLATLQGGVVGMTLPPGQPRPPDEWGVLRAWAWALSRVMDYLETDPDVDATQVSFSGHSRFGKVVLLAAAMDTRIAMVFATCSGEMGASLSRRDWGETVDDMAQLFAPHFAGNFQKWVGRWNDMPVDSHMLIALIAPRPVFITGGTQDQWSDPKGEFLAEVAAGPVYRLLGKKDLGVTEMPRPDTPLVDGELAFHEHTGGHTVTAAEQRLFLDFASRYFKVNKAETVPQVKKDQPKAGKAPAPIPGLHVNDPKAFRGYTLFAPLNSTKVFLIDMEGKVAKTWDPATKPAGSVYLLDNGHLLRPCVYEEKPTPFGLGGGSGGRVQEFTWQGELVWDYQLANDKELAHHDVRRLPNGNLLMVVGEMKNAEEAMEAGRKNRGNVRSDCVFEVRPTGKTTGEIVWQWRMWDHLVQDHDKSKSNFGNVAAHPELIDVNFGPPGKAPKAGAPPGKGGVDWTHTNSVDYNAELDQIIISVHNFSEVWIIDHSTTTAQAASHSGGKSGKGGDLLYRWGNPLAYRRGTAADQRLFVQHNAHWIPKGLPGEGHLLVFSNGTNRPGGNSSSVDEFVPPVDPKGNYALKPGSAFGPEKALWSYSAPNKADFYSSYISGAQRLPNGDTLICSGADGIFFETTADKEIVWKYVNPLRAKAKGGGAPTAGAVFRAYRYPADFPGLVGRDLKATKTVEELLKTEPAKK